MGIILFNCEYSMCVVSPETGMTVSDVRFGAITKEAWDFERLTRRFGRDCRFCMGISQKETVKSSSGVEAMFYVI